MPDLSFIELLVKYSPIKERTFSDSFNYRSTLTNLDTGEATYTEPNVYLDTEEQRIEAYENLVSKNFGVADIAAITSDGKIDSEEAFKIIITGAEKGFENFAEKFKAIQEKYPVVNDLLAEHEPSHEEREEAKYNVEKTIKESFSNVDLTKPENKILFEKMVEIELKGNHLFDVIEQSDMEDHMKTDFVGEVLETATPIYDEHSWETSISDAHSILSGPEQN